MSSSNPSGGPPDLSSLQDNFTQQQVLAKHISFKLFQYKKLTYFQAKITALKELVRQSEATQGKNTASAQEKVKKIAQRLTHLKSKSSRARQGGNNLKLKITFFKVYNLVYFFFREIY